MKIKVKGEMTLTDIRQALFETLNSVEEEFALRHSRGATLFINPTNGFGDKVVPRDQKGEEVTKVQSNGPYRPAADKYDI